MYTHICTQLSGVKTIKTDDKTKVETLFLGGDPFFVQVPKNQMIQFIISIYLHSLSLLQQKTKRLLLLGGDPIFVQVQKNQFFFHSIICCSKFTLCKYIDILDLFICTKPTFGTMSKSSPS